jgi:glucose-6-phosphate 1-dehydrogenase
MEADDIRREKIKILTAAREPKYEDVPKIAIRGQYGGGTVKGQTVPGYREEEGVKPDSQTDTYAAMQLFVDTWRWGGVPFYLRSGKRMAKKLTEIVIYLKPTPHKLFREQRKGNSGGGIPPNQIVINVQPDEGIRLRFEGKVPGASGGGMNIKSVVMDFDYVKQFKAEPPEAYETLLLDVMRGDQTLYKHRDEVEAAWRVVQPIVNYWTENPQDDLPNYASGTWGPSAADVMMARDGRHWHNV